MSDERFEIELPLVPSSKKNSRMVVNGIPLVSKRARTHAQLIEQALYNLDGAPYWKREEVGIRVVHRIAEREADDTVFVQVYRVKQRPNWSDRNGRRRDLDNIVTTLQDSLQGFAFRNDSQIGLIVAERDWV